MEGKRIVLRSLNRTEQDVQVYKREDIILEKGVALTEPYLESIQKLLERYMNFFTAYPDLYLDIIAPVDAQIKLFPYQRVFLRAIMRFKNVYVTACRAFSKSFITILGMVLQCIFMPGTKRFICAPNKNQAAQIAKEKLTEIFRAWPLLRKEVIGGDLVEVPGNYGKDYVTLRFRNGSQFDVVGALESSLGGRRQGGLLDEIKLHDEEMVNTVVLPLLNVSRRLPDGSVNYKEPNQQQICCTSAWLKTSFAYIKLIDMFVDSIINPKNTFTFGCDYRVPQMHGLLARDFVKKLKMSPSFNQETFAREYLSIWTGGGEESWFDFDKLQKYRKIKNPEKHAFFRAGSNQYYLLSVDVGRLHDSTIVCVWRVNVIKDKHYSTLVNLIVLGRQAETKTFHQQAIDLKKLIRDFDPKEVVIDCNGLGVGLADEMIKTQMDDNGEEFGPLGFFNNDDYKKIQPKGCPNILYSLKANGPLKSKIHSNAYSRVNNGMVRFLIKEQEARSMLLSTKVGQKMSIKERVERLIPHEMTTKLFEEMANLRLKKGSGIDIVLEQINTHYPDDKYSAFAYGLWRIKEIEEESFKRKRRFDSFGNQRQLVFFTEGR